MSERKGDWTQTFSQGQFWALDPRPEEVHPEDIAHHLSLLCRFGGACSVLYTVAEHCVRCSLARERSWLFAQGALTLLHRLVFQLAWRGSLWGLRLWQRLVEPSERSLALLLHDAPEAYVVDVPRPVKRFLTNYWEIEAGVARAVEQRFRLAVGALDSRAVNHWDAVLLATEARDLMGGACAEENRAGRWGLQTDPLSDRIRPWSFRRAERMYLERLKHLTEKNDDGE